MPAPHNVSQTGIMPRQIPSVQPRHLTVTITVRSSSDTTLGAPLLRASSYVSIPHHSCFMSLVSTTPRARSAVKSQRAIMRVLIQRQSEVPQRWLSDQHPTPSPLLLGGRDHHSRHDKTSCPAPSWRLATFSHQASEVVYEVGFARTSHVAFVTGSLRLTPSES